MAYKDEPSMLDIQPGTKITDYLEVGPYFEHKLAKIRKFVRIPYTVIRGTKDGLKICVTSGVHGTEYVGIATTVKLAREVKPEILSGTLILVHTVDEPAFKSRGYICPIDGVNVQGIWPGNPEGSISYMIAHRVFSEFISKSNYYLDLHGADSHESEIAYAHFHRMKKSTQVDLQSEEMAKALGFEYVTVSEGNASRGYSFRIGPEYGIPTALCEFGQGDRLLLDEVEKVHNGVLNVLRLLKMLPGEVQVHRNQKIIGTLKVRINRDGLFYTKIKPGDKLAKGDVIGEVKDLTGETLETVRAPTNGVVLLFIHNPVVEAGEKIMSWGVLP